MTTTRQRNPENPEYTKKSFELMLSTLKKEGCNPQRSTTRQSILQSACPLPHCKTSTDTSVSIDTRTARYTCRACGSEGTPTAFAARRWHVSASQAHALIEHYPLEDLLVGRPPMTPDMLQTRTDSFPLGVAMAHYADQLEKHFTPLQWLSKMSVTPDQARAANVGYSSGEGLREALATAGLDDDQISRSQLFTPSTGHERLTGNIILADTDHTGAVTWIISTDPNRDTGIAGYRLNPTLPPIYAMPFRARSAIVGLHHINSASLPLFITDDFRTYLAAAVTDDVQALLLIQRTRNEPPEQRTQRLDYTASNITSRARMSAIIIAAHDPLLAAGIRDRLAASHPSTPILAGSKALALQIGSAASRSFPNVLAPDTFEARSQRAQHQLQQILNNHGSARGDRQPPPSPAQNQPPPAEDEPPPEHITQ